MPTQQQTDASSRVERPMNNRYIRYALTSQAGLLLYFQLVSWVPLGRWNYQPCCPVASELLSRGKFGVDDALYLLAFVLPIVTFAFGVKRKNRGLLLLGLSFYVVWLIWQLISWWPPYIVGADERWKEVYARAFSASTQLLPSWGDHLPPDGMHLALQVLLIIVVCSGYLAVIRTWKAGHA